MAETTKQQLLERLRWEQSQWETLLKDIGAEQLMLPGATDEWRGQDVIAHLTTWWRRDVAGLQNAQRGKPPEPHPSQDDVQVINNWIYYTNRDRSLAAVLDDAQEVWQDFIELFGSFPAADLVEPGRFAWLKEEALGPHALADFVRHFHDEHEGPLRAWLAKLDEAQQKR